MERTEQEIDGKVPLAYGAHLPWERQVAHPHAVVVEHRIRILKELQVEGIEPLLMTIH
jgi:hypothetical protein